MLGVFAGGGGWKEQGGGGHSSQLTVDAAINIALYSFFVSSSKRGETCSAGLVRSANLTTQNVLMCLYLVPPVINNS
jgi:hypothetical protein